MEEWKDIKGYEGIYQVSSLGNVKSLDREVKRVDGIVVHVKGRMITIRQAREGYCLVALYNKGRGKYKLIHRLVAEAFLCKPKETYEINHINHVRDDNRKENLEWCTHSQNMIDAAIFENDNYKDSHNYHGTHKCIDCGKLISYQALRCRKCSSKIAPKSYKIGHSLSANEVSESLKRNNGNFTRASKEFNMTDNALRKWCKKYNLPAHSKDWKK